jgi:predicted acyl esterase
LQGITAITEAYYLDSTHNANEVFRSGSLGRSLAQGSPDHFRFTPGDVMSPQLEAQASLARESLIDQRLVLGLSGNELVYHTEPFQKDTELSGFFRLIAWFAIDRPDVDLAVSVYLIGVDGESVRLSTDLMRARYRQGLREPKLIQTRGAQQYDFSRFTFVSRQVHSGERLRLVIAPTTLLQMNYGSGGIVSEESARDAKTVTVTLLHDRTHASALYVPLGQPEAASLGRHPTP